MSNLTYPPVIKCSEAMTVPSLNALLDSWSVLPPVGVWDEYNIKPGVYHPVCNDDDGVVAYFLRESGAFRFRLDMINRTLNP